MPTPAGAAKAATPHPLLPDDRLKHLYTTLLRTRLLRGRNRLHGNPKASVAREAIVAATVTHLVNGEAVLPAAGDQLAALARGHALRRIISAEARQESLDGVLPSTTGAAARFALATGYAMARRDAKQATLVFSGPGVTSLDELAPALAYASAHKLGVVFVIESAYDSNLSDAAQTDKCGVIGIPVDGNDVVAIYRVAQESFQRARRGVGPTLIDCKPWALDGKADPVRRLEQSLERRGLATARLKERTIDAFTRELSAPGNVKTRG